MFIESETLPSIVTTYASLGNIFLFVFAVFVIYSAILLYHWIRYAVASPVIWLVTAAYFSISAVLFSVMLGAVALS